VTSALGPYRASMTQARRRRALKALLVATLAVFGLIAWSSYPNYRSQRKVLDGLENGRIDVEQLLQQSGGFSCSESACQIVDRSGRGIGPEFPITPGQFGPQPAPQPEPSTPSATTTSGTPDATAAPTEQPPPDKFGFGGGLPISREDLERALPELIPEFRADLAKAEKRLSPRASFQSRARAAGVFWGVLFAVLAASTLIGAEWRWGVWRTLLTHEPRRIRMVMAKMATVWTVIAIGLAVTLAFVAGLDAIFRSISHVGADGGPSVAGIARTTGKSLLSLELYSTLAAAAAMTIRASFGGIAALALLLGDGLATMKWHWLRHVLPTQQIARLLPPPADNFFGGGYVWWTSVGSGRVVCEPRGVGISECREIPVPPIPQWRAILVLLAWIAAASLIASFVVRSRDVPQ
jgi:ABC-type transport system involved in multi-copper enzyme maturation permease subunit